MWARFSFYGMQALWFLSTALGTSLAGVFASRWSPEGQASCFGVLEAVVIALAVVLAVVAKPVHRLMSGVD